MKEFPAKRTFWSATL